MFVYREESLENVLVSRSRLSTFWFVSLGFFFLDVFNVLGISGKKFEIRIR